MPRCCGCGRATWNTACPTTRTPIQRLIELQLTQELASEAKGFNEDWPSDIYCSINGVELGYWTSPAIRPQARRVYARLVGIRPESVWTAQAAGRKPSGRVHRRRAHRPLHAGRPEHSVRRRNTLPHKRTRDRRARRRADAVRPRLRQLQPGHNHAHGIREAQEAMPRDRPLRRAARYCAADA